jgi:hypothetical protein
MIATFLLIASLNGSTESLGGYASEIQCEIAKSNMPKSNIVYTCKERDMQEYVDTICAAANNMSNRFPAAKEQQLRSCEEVKQQMKIYKY